MSRNRLTGVPCTVGLKHLGKGLPMRIVITLRRGKNEVPLTVEGARKVSKVLGELADQLEKAEAAATS